MTDLAAFGIDPDERPLVARRVTIRTPIEEKIAGFLAHDHENDMRVYTTLRGDAHFYRNGDGWAISDAILAHIERMGASRIIVHDGTTPEDDVWVFSAHDYYTGEPVPTADLEDRRDPQTFVPKEEHIAHYPNYARALFIRPFDRVIGTIPDRSVDL